MTLIGAVSPRGKIRRPRDQEVKAGVVLFSFTPNDPLGEFVLLILETLVLNSQESWLLEHFHHGHHPGS